MLKPKKLLISHSVIFAIITFIFSMIVSPYYTGGDQEYYIYFYEAIKDLGFIEGYLIYYGSLGAQEPFYYLLIFMFSRVVDKFLLMSLINAIMGYFLSYNLIKLKVNKLIIYSLLLNYYFVVLMFSAERLKISLTLLLMVLTTKSIFKSLTLMLFVVLSHIQSILLLFVIKFGLMKKKSRFLFGKNKIRRSIIYIFITGVIVSASYFMKDYVLLKFEVYNVNSEIENLIKPIIFLLLSLFFAKQKKLKVFLSFMPILFFSYLIGDERINIFSFFLFFYFASRVKKGINFIMIVTLCYYLYKGFDFTNNILLYQSGYN